MIFLLKAQDILFALQMDGEYVFNLLYKNYEKPYTKSNKNTSMLEVIATVILRCFVQKSIRRTVFDQPAAFQRIGCWIVVRSKS